MLIVSDDVLKLSQPAVIVLFAPMLMHLLQYILFLSLSYVNHVYKLAQRDWNFPCALFSLASCDTSSSTSIGSFASVVVLVSVSSSDQGFSFSDVVKNDIFGWFIFQILPFWEAFCCHSTVFVIIETRVWKTESIGWLYDWFSFSPDYVRGMKQKLRTSRNKISMQIPVTGAQCTIVWAIRDGNAPYWRTHHFLMGHIKF
jgi:hypothetical protein